MQCVELLYSSTMEVRKYKRYFLGSALHLPVFVFMVLYLHANRVHSIGALVVSFVLCTVSGSLWAAMDKKPLVSVIAAGRATWRAMLVAHTAFFLSCLVLPGCANPQTVFLLALTASTLLLALIAKIRLRQ